MLRKRSLVFLLLALLTVSILPGLTVAATDPVGGELRPVGRFDDRIQPRSGGSIGVEPLEAASLAPGDELRIGWDEFVLGHWYRDAASNGSRKTR